MGYVTRKFMYLFVKFGDDQAAEVFRHILP